MERWRMLHVAAGLWLCSVTETGALEIALYIDETAGVKRTAEAVTSGVPFSRGLKMRTKF